MGSLKLLQGQPGCTLADVAARCAYYNQPHFVPDFKAYASVVPSAQVGYFPADAPTDLIPNLVQYNARCIDDLHEMLNKHGFQHGLHGRPQRQANHECVD